MILTGEELMLVQKLGKTPLGKTRQGWEKAMNKDRLIMLSNV
jgi:hypothetical protein